MAQGTVSQAAHREDGGGPALPRGARAPSALPGGRAGVPRSWTRPGNADLDDVELDAGGREAGLCDETHAHQRRDEFATNVQGCRGVLPGRGHGERWLQPRSHDLARGAGGGGRAGGQAPRTSTPGGGGPAMRPSGRASGHGAPPGHHRSCRAAERASPQSPTPGDAPTSTMPNWSGAGGRVADLCDEHTHTTEWTSLPNVRKRMPARCASRAQTRDEGLGHDLTRGWGYGPGRARLGWPRPGDRHTARTIAVRRCHPRAAHSSTPGNADDDDVEPERAEASGGPV